MIEIGKRISPETAKYFAFKNQEEWMKVRCGGLTTKVGADGFEYMKKHGVRQGMSKPKYYALYASRNGAGCR